MKYSLKVKDTQREYVLDNKDEQLVVTISVLNEEGEEVEERKLGFIKTISVEEVQVELQNFLTNYQIEADGREAQVALDEENEQINETMNSLQDLEISAIMEDDDEVSK